MLLVVLPILILANVQSYSKNWASDLQKSILGLDLPPPFYLRSKLCGAEGLGGSGTGWNSPHLSWQLVDTQLSISPGCSQGFSLFFHPNTQLVTKFCGICLPRVCLFHSLFSFPTDTPWCRPSSSSPTLLQGLSPCLPTKPPSTPVTLTVWSRDSWGSLRPLH